MLESNPLIKIGLEFTDTIKSMASWWRVRRRPTAAAILSLALLLSVSASGESPEWGKFQNGGDNSTEMKLPTEWSPEKNIAWTAEIEGYGQSTPIVAHDQIVVTSTSGDMKDNYHVISYAIRSGEKNWQVDLKNPSPFANTPMVSRAAPSAIATAEGFIAFFEGGVLAALAKDGSTLWQKDLVEIYGPIKARHGLSASLEQDRDHVFVWIERGEEPYLLALNKKSGEEIWKAPGIGATSWSSPRMVGVGNSSHLVCSAIGKIVGYDPKTGERLWELEDIANNSSCTPTPVGDRQFLIGASNGRGETNPSAAAENNGLVEIKQDAGGAFSATFKWRATKATSSFGELPDSDLGNSAIRTARRGDTENGRVEGLAERVPRPGAVGRLALHTEAAFALQWEWSATVLCPLDRFASVHAWWRRRRGEAAPPRFGTAWAFRLFQIQTTFVYVGAAWSKLIGPEWQTGIAMFYVSRLDDVFGKYPLPDFLFDSMPMIRLLTW